MNAKIIAIMALLAVALAGAAVMAADQADANGVPMTVEKEFYLLPAGNDSTIQIEVGIEAKETATTITASSSNQNAVTITASVEVVAQGTTATFTATYVAAGTSVITFTNSDETATCIIYAGDAAMQYMSTTEGLQAIVYSDALVYMDTSAIDMGSIQDVYFEVSYDADGDGQGTATTMTVGPMSAQKRMAIDIPGYVLFDGTATTTITMKNWTNKTDVGTAITIKSNAALTFTLDSNLPAGKIATKYDVTKPFVSNYTSAARADTVDTIIKSAGYTFLGWGAAEDATTYFDVPLSEGTLTVADYMFAVNGNQVNTGTEQDPAIVYKVFAIWNDVYNIKVVYAYNSEHNPNVTPEIADGSVYKVIDGDSNDLLVGSAVAPKIAKAGDSFILRITQNTTNPGNYKYTVQLFSAYAWVNNAVQSTTVTTGTTFDMITNGVWLITNVQESLFIVVTAVDYTAATTGYHFGIDSIVNNTTDNVENGTASLSWDAVDAAPVGKVKFDGTYFRDVDGMNVYGNFATAGSHLNYSVIVDNGASGESANVLSLSSTTGYNYDYTVFTTVNSGYYLYAVQGLYDHDANGDFTANDVDSTPWALVEN